MKTLSSITLIGCLLFACSREEEIPTDEEVRQKAFEKMEQNAIILDQSLKKTKEIFLGLGDIQSKISAQNNRDAFIRYMLDKTKNVFDEVVEANRAPLGLQKVTFTFTTTSTSAYPFKEQLDLIPVGIEGPNPGSGVLDLFSAGLDAELNRKGFEKQIIIDSYSLGVANSSYPRTPVTVTYGAALHVKNSIEAMILTHKNPDELDAAIEDFISDNPDSKVFLGLLLPAVQKVREMPATSGNNYRGLTTVVQGSLAPDMQLSWDQKMRRAVFLAGIYVVTSDDFVASDENYASIAPQRTMYEAMTVLMWAMRYDK